MDPRLGLGAPRECLSSGPTPRAPNTAAEFDPERRVILYCSWGGRSALAADTLRQMGYRAVAHLEGGLKAWKESGRPVERP